MRPSALVFAIALAGCPRPAPAPQAPAPAPPDAAVAADAPPPVPLDEDLPRLALRSVELYEDIARTFTEVGANCADATAKLHAMQPTYADVARANAKVLHEGAAKALRAELEPHAARMDAAAKTIATSATLTSCSQDPAFEQAFDALVGTP